MDAIRKKMQSLKAETDGLYATIGRFEDSTKEYNRMADQEIFPTLCILWYFSLWTLQ